ncbi:MAG: RIP metalloprotease RseP [Bacteroidales bacterium]|nr:RIP metalloprotease RseP [Candidatus Sodaliphilus aphodohippi]
MDSTFWFKTLEVIMALGLLVIIHEFGHYSFSRLFGVWVEKFYLFFNPWFSIAKWKPKAKVDKDGNENKNSWRATEYGIGWLPLGGYCKIAGMIDESMDTEQMKDPAKPYEFRSKPAWQRLFIMIGGVLFNFILAIVIYAGIVYTYGEMYINFTDATEGMDYCDSAHKYGFVDGDIPLMADDHQLTYLDGDELQTILTAKTVKVLRNHKDTVTINLPENFIFIANKDAEAGQMFMNYRLPVVISQTQARMGAEKAGLKSGDRIIAVNNESTPSYTELTPTLKKYSNKTVSLSYIRNGKECKTNVQIDSDGKLGIQLTDPTKIFHVNTVSYNILESIPRGIEMGCDKLVSYVKQLKLVFSAEGAKSLGGFGAIGSIFPESWNWLDFWNITAFLSIILAVMNILPIPALDGGHVLFLLYEMITGRQPSEKFLERAQTFGMLLLLALLLFANGNDIYRYFFK